jgi:hypothetical protein
MPAAAESTTNEAEQCVQAKMMSLLDFGAESVEPAVCCIEQLTKQETYRKDGECLMRLRPWVADDLGRRIDRPASSLSGLDM